MDNAFISELTINEGRNDNDDIFYGRFLSSSVSGDDFKSTYTVTFLVKDNANPMFSYSDMSFTYDVNSYHAGVDSNGDALYAHIIRAQVKIGAEFDYANGHVSLDVLIENGAEQVSKQSATITLRDINEAPTDITIGGNSATTITHEISEKKVIGTLAAIDPDAADNSSSAFNKHSFTLSGTHSNLFEIVEDATDGSFTLQFITTPDNDFRYRDAGNELTLTITATDNMDGEAGDQESYEKTFTINVEEKVVLEAPREAVTVDENGYFTFMQKGEINAEGKYARDDDDLYLTGEPTKLVSATFTVTRGTLSTGQKLDNYNTDNPDDYFMVDSVVHGDGHQLTFTNIQVQDLAALIEGLIYYAPDDEKTDSSTLTINIENEDQKSIASSTTTINTRAVDDPSSIINLDNYLKHQDLVYTIQLNEREESTNIDDYSLAGINAGEWVRLDHTDRSADNDKAQIKDIDGHTVAGSRLHIRIKFDDSVTLERTDTTHIRVNDGLGDGKAVLEKTPMLLCQMFLI